MRDFKVNRNVIKRGSDNIISLGYCELNSLLSFFNKLGYNSGVYGWNYDAYSFHSYDNGRVVIVTGYRPLAGVRPSMELVKKYEEKTKKLRCDNSLSWEKKNDTAKIMVLDFIEEVLN